MFKVTRLDGKFVLEETPAHAARKEKTRDVESLKKPPSLEELAAVVERILTRLDDLEK